MLAQLANIPTRITLYELITLSKQTRKALREVLQNSEVFLPKISKMIEDKEEIYATYHQTFKKIPCIPSILEDMQVKNSKYHQPLYYKGYIGPMEVNQIQIYPRSALSIMPRRIL